MSANPSPHADDLTLTALAGLPLSPRNRGGILGLGREGASDSFPALWYGFVKAFDKHSVCEIPIAAISGNLVSPHSLVLG